MSTACPVKGLTAQGKIIGEMMQDGEIESTVGDKWYVPFLTDKSVYKENTVDYSITDTQKLANKMDKMFSDNDTDDSDDIDIDTDDDDDYEE